MVDDDWVRAPLWRLFGLPSHSISSRDLSGSVARSQSQRYLALSLQSARGILPLATYVSTMPLQKIPPSDNIIYFSLKWTGRERWEALRSAFSIFGPEIAIWAVEHQIFR